MLLSLRILEEGGSEVGLGNFVWLALAVFFLMVFLGWLASSKGWLKKEEEVVSTSQDHDSHDSHHDQKIELSHASGKKDDLTALEGIGPKVATLLTGIGIKTFEDLATADPVKVKAALDGAGYAYMEPAGWIDQAVLAARGDQAGLKKLQDAQKGGRKVA
jgi:predicted flap endonuclease-1-like 5' DNA nuclease